ncbi:MAG: cell division protein FtsL [Alphaproteobacteria bacterium]|nr:cell division protein FtsL [Alphaproteobacteria bacterium]
MIKLANAFLVVNVLIAAFFLYSLEHATRALERNIAKTEKSITDERERIKLLNAEWASLTRPDRIQKMAEEQLGLKTIQAQQFVPLADIGAKVPQTPPVKLEAQNADAIGKMLETLQ